MRAVVRKIDDIWQKLEARASVKLEAIRSERHFKVMTAFMNELLEEIGDPESHPLMGLLDVVIARLRTMQRRFMRTRIT